MNLIRKTISFGRIARTIAITLTLCTLGFSQRVAPPSATAVRYFLRDDLQGLWCVYSNKETWNSRANSVRAEMMGSIEYSGGRVWRIFVHQQNSNVEWSLEDRYELNQQRNIVGLLRRIVYISEEELKEESYHIAAGKATKTASSAWNLKTNERLPLPRPLDPYEAWPLFTRTRDLPFAVLIEGTTKSTLSKEEHCVPVHGR